MVSSLLIVADARDTRAQPTGLRRLQLQVSARADVPAPTLKRAQQQVLWLFARIDVAVDWIGCGLDRRAAAAAAPGAPLTIGVAVMSRESAAFRSSIPPEVMGAVVRDNQGHATAWVLFERIERASDRFALDSGLVLGQAMAHEIGHLLLPRGTHGPAGIMRASWRMEDMRDGVQGQLGFSEAEAALIHARLAL